MIFTMEDGRQWDVNEERAYPCFLGYSWEYPQINTSYMSAEKIQIELQRITSRLQFDHWSGQYNDRGY
jgi:hypothetical protein